MKTPFLASEIKCLMRQLLSGVAFLHENWVIHRDLKTSNLLLNNRVRSPSLSLSSALSISVSLFSFVQSLQYVYFAVFSIRVMSICTHYLDMASYLFFSSSNIFFSYSTSSYTLTWERRAY
jgi:serine/threonine protein kinase